MTPVRPCAYPRGERSCDHWTGEDLPPGGTSPMNSPAWTAALTAIATGLTFALLRWFFPVRVADPSEEPLTDEERRVFRRWEAGSLLPFFVFAPVLGYAWYLALRGAASLFPHGTPGRAIPGRDERGVLGHPRHLPRDRHIGDPSGTALPHLAPRPLSPVRAFLPRARGIRREASIGGVRHAHLRRIGRVLPRRGDELRAVHRCRDRHRPAAVVPDHVLRVCAVRAIEHRTTVRAPSGNTGRSPHYVIRFDDGTSWSTRDGLRDPVPQVDDPIVQFVSRRSGQAIVDRP